ncbi:MAG: PAS domain-containing protein [Cytophagaceae bacterium]|nr:PAS domain-containing protein [Cytophagaceae bacterium]MBK9936448.1 PAS domain-containing protein [Cytophagaceae bacterium]MBL0300197.1 PAS domain-containing protein [Cytophagaceae bacterium]MBL0327133.1 PAS domain-containing protein [Cytophagaceae bacterium]
MKLNPISIPEINQKFLRDEKLDVKKFEEELKPTIETISNFAIGPYYWLIPDQSNMTIVAASPNTQDLTPYRCEEWINKDVFFWFETMHPEDREFVASSLALSIELQESLPLEKAELVQMNIYLRMLDKDKNFRWVLMQFPKRLFNENGKVISTLILVTDLSHFPKNFSRMLTLIDASNKKSIFFATQVDNKKFISLDIPQISKRELEILQLMVRGLNSPQIAENLFLSYHTIENHKRNLRRKTNTKTTAELIDFVWRNNLI